MLVAILKWILLPNIGKNTGSNFEKTSEKFETGIYTI